MQVSVKVGSAILLFLRLDFRRDFQAQRCSVEAVPRFVEPQAQRYSFVLVAGFGFHRGNQQTPVPPFWQGQSRVATKIPLLTMRGGVGFTIADRKSVVYCNTG